MRQSSYANITKMKTMTNNNLSAGIVLKCSKCGRVSPKSHWNPVLAMDEGCANNEIAEQHAMEEVKAFNSYYGWGLNIPEDW